jgi:20S proteasome alpha/beta subunit
MTIAITVKVNDGVVLASDSATTMFVQGVPYNQYYHADKVFNLKKGLPIGAVTWGAGNIGVASISTLVKDFRRTLTDVGEQYTVQSIGERLRAFLLERQRESYGPEATDLPRMGLRVAGYSSGEQLAEEFEFLMGEGEQGASQVQLVRPKEQMGLSWNGQPEAVQRLVLGFSPRIVLALKDLEVPEDEIPKIIAAFRQKTEVFVVEQAMPIADAIDLAVFIVTLTAEFSRFSPGLQTVGGPTDIAAITKHEGFKWIKRKHYYSRDLNPEPGTDRT